MCASGAALHPVGSAPESAAVDNAPRARQSEARRAAEWLLRARLDPRVSAGVPAGWLATQLRASRLLSTHGWSWDDVADLLHGAPDFPHLPRSIRTPRAWIRARLQRATPTLPPRRLAEGSWTAFLRDRAAVALPSSSTDVAGAGRDGAAVDAAARAQAMAIAAAIAACGLCDHHGWRSYGPGLPDVVCSHDPAESW